MREGTRACAIAMGWVCGAGRSDSTAVQWDQGVEMCACWPCATAAACSWRRACAAAWSSDSHRLVSPGCAAQGAPCKRPGRWAAGRRAQGGWGDCGGARHAHAVLPCCRPVHAIAATETRANSWIPPRSMAQGAPCSLRGAGRSQGDGSWMRGRRTRSRRGRRCSASPWGSASGRGCAGAHPRGDEERSTRRVKMKEATLIVDCTTPYPELDLTYPEAGKQCEFQQA